MAQYQWKLAQLVFGKIREKRQWKLALFKWNLAQLQWIWHNIFYSTNGAEQSVTSRLETSRYRDFFHFFESIGIGLDKFGLEIKVSVSVSENFSLKKRLSISLENIWSQKKVSGSVSKIWVSKKFHYRFGLKKKFL